MCILLYCCTAVLLCCCAAVLLYRCNTVLLYRCSVVPLYRCTAVPVHCCTAVLLYKVFRIEASGPRSRTEACERSTQKVIRAYRNKF